MNSKIALLSAVLSALALISSGASATTSNETSLSATVPSASSAVEQLARRGRRNDDPVGGEDAGCDDHGSDLCAIKLSKHGRDDLVDGEDDHGVDFILG
jgi:exo-beta-1,3-glucanase (GH17 family)